MILKTILRNAGWLGFIQVLSYAIPVFTLPVVTRAFGPGLYGILGVLSSYAAYAGLVAEYGFPKTGPRMVAKAQGDIAAVSSTVSAIVSTQCLLGILGALLFVAVLLFLPFGRDYALVSIVILVQMLATAVAPQWIFIGLEEMRAYAIIQLTVRVFAAILTVRTIRAPDDLLFYVGINCVAAVSIILLSFLVLGRWGIRLRVPRIRDIAIVARQASDMFAANMFISLYTTSNVLIVALVLGPEAAGSFALADKIRLATGGIIGPITQAVYPFVCRIAGREESAEEARTKRLFFRGVVGVAAAISLTLFVLAPVIIWAAGGNAFVDAVPVLKLLAFLPVIIGLSNTLGQQTMLPLHMDREYTVVVGSAAVLGVTALYSLSWMFDLVGAGMAMVAVEIYVTIAFAVVVQRRTSILSLFFREA